MTDEQIISKLAEYLSIAPYLKVNSPDSDYQRANQLALELAVWLPEDLYKELGQSISKPSEECNPLTVISHARFKYTNTKINPDIIITHAPNIGIKEKT